MNVFEQHSEEYIKQFADLTLFPRVGRVGQIIFL